jgi:hypothetical protein
MKPDKEGPIKFKPFRWADFEPLSLLNEVSKKCELPGIGMLSVTWKRDTNKIEEKVNELIFPLGYFPTTWFLDLEIQLNSAQETSEYEVLIQFPTESLVYSGRQSESLRSNKAVEIKLTYLEKEVIPRFPSRKEILADVEIIFGTKK